MKYNPRYYRLDIIPEHRLDIIDIRLKWPVDAVQLLKKIKKRRLIDLEYDFVPDCSTDFDAEARYYIELLLHSNQREKAPPLSIQVFQR